MKAANEISKDGYLGAMSELVFMRRVMNEAIGNGWLVYHDEDSRRNRRGFMDLVLCKPPILLMPELKTEHGKVRPEQQVWLTATNASGVYAPVWRPSDWPMIERILQGKTKPTEINHGC